MATNHQQTLSVYQMVLDRVPFILDDSQAIFTAVAIVSRAGSSIVLAGDYIPFIRKETTHTFATPATTAVVAAFSYDGDLDQTTVTYYTLVPGVNSASTVAWDANYNEELISRFILEMMVILQSCYNIDPPANVGDEQYYNDLQKIVLAELVAYYLVFWATVGNSQGGMNVSGDSSLPTGGRYVKSASADGLSTTWEYLNIKNTAFLAMDAEKIMAQFKANACQYGKQLGCEIEICNGAVSCKCSIKMINTPFIVAKRGNVCRPFNKGGGRC